MPHNRKAYIKHRKKIKRRRIFTFILLPIFVVILGATSYGALLYNKAQSVMDKSYNPLDWESKKREEKVDPHVDNVSILFVGVDDSKSRNLKDATRTDALMLATLNEKEKSVKLLSIPRDSLVYIPSKGYEDKINHAYVSGGIRSTIETVEETLDVPVDYYVKMNFEAFIDVVDALGGIEVEVPYTISEKNSKDKSNAIHLEPGLQELDGEEALALARTRKQDNDIERGKRQQEILKAIMKKAISVKSLTKYTDVIEAVGENMETDLSFGEMKAFIDYATASKGLNVETLTLQGADLWTDDGYYYQLDQEALEEIKMALKSHLEISSAADSSHLAVSESEQ